VQNQRELISYTNDSKPENINTVAVGLIDNRTNFKVWDNTCTTKETCGGGGDQGQSQLSVMWDARRYNDWLFNEHSEDSKEDLIEQSQQVQAAECRIVKKYVEHNGASTDSECIESFGEESIKLCAI